MTIDPTPQRRSPAAPAAGPDRPAPHSATSAAAAADPRTVAALSTMLVATHAAVYAAAAAGGTLAPLGPAAAGVRDLARLSYVAHQQLRDDLTSAIRARGGEAPPALPAYRLPASGRGTADALALLARVEDASAAAAHDALTVLVGDIRALAVDALVGTAVRAQRARLAGGTPIATATQALPGT